MVLLTGKTNAKVSLTNMNTGLFHGYLSTELDKPEKTRSAYAGYANIQSLTKYRSFKREEPFDLDQYTHFLIKVRGDGRSYMMLLSQMHTFDMTETYMFAYPLYTRGGPYWQHAKIPFSKFFHLSQGRISDVQYPFSKKQIKNIGFTCMDDVDGPFSLELDFIGVLRDNEFTEEFAYETYRTEKFVANT
jgi:NADH dehydrogenase [ubiquinone] 1 alpha subcomplex assembly factor 1